ncbi:5-oxoprolinase subunit PxpB [Fusobacterium sp. IOR10]|uniref:5-oxoprolinase subunit PxpB n=1 Tax=Fusobacterium sp. IOR10 TaxID=2665157 RepID=UPI0013D88F28|nr:5-oxoprolinase subunit PxpB [Fusobacterium sp. IOR10]
MKFLKAGDSALVIELGNEISPVINFKLKKITEFLDNLNKQGIKDLLPTYRSIIVYYNPLLVSFDEIKNIVEENCNFENEKIDEIEKEIVEIPVLYGGEYGPDLENIAKHNNITTEEVIKIHTSGEYLVYMLGFTPGFPYLGGMSKKIATPRLKEPRTKIPAGSVGIAGEQTGVYPIESPGGWQLLGRSPLNFFNPNSDKPFLLKAGQYIKFVSVTEEEYLKLKGKED